MSPKLEWNPLAHVRNAGKSATAEAMWNELRKLASVQFTTMTARMPGPRDSTLSIMRSTVDGIYPVRNPIIVRPNNAGMSQIGRYLEFSPHAEEQRILQKLIDTGKPPKQLTRLDHINARLAVRMQPLIDSAIRNRVAPIPTDTGFLGNVVRKAKYYL